MEYIRNIFNLFYIKKEHKVKYKVKCYNNDCQNSFYVLRNIKEINTSYCQTCAI